MKHIISISDISQFPGQAIAETVIASSCEPYRETKKLVCRTELNSSRDGDQFVVARTTFIVKRGMSIIKHTSYLDAAIAEYNKI